MESVSGIVDRKSKFLNDRTWAPVVKKKRFTRAIFCDVFFKYLRSYCDSSSLVGYRYLVEPQRPWIERLIWIVLHVTTICILGLLVYGAYREYLEVPVVTVVDADNYPLNLLDFPGIAICNINRISKKAAISLASELVSSNVTTMKVPELLELLSTLGDLYDTDTETNATLDRLLDTILNEYYLGHYDIPSIMKKLSPDCFEGLLTCFFQGVRQNCSDIFAFRKTQNGYCCTFNYAREPDDIPEKNGDVDKKVISTYNISGLGITNGLSLVMEPFLEDYFYPIFPTPGWKVTVFNAHDYPDNLSGSVDETTVAPRSETFIELDATSFYSKTDIRSVSVLKRGCIFTNELPVMYTYSDCLVDCRAAVVWDTCRCRPFFLPRRGTNEFRRKICNLGHLECLHSFRDVYSTVLSDKVEDSKGQRHYTMDPKTAQLCDSCYPACDDVRYFSQSSAANLYDGVYNTELLDNVRVANQSIVHIYFMKHGSVRLRQESSYYWYELLSNIGGICGVFIGFSLISIAEFLYFALCMIHEFSRGRRETIKIEDATRVERGKTGTGMKWRKIGNANRFPSTLYWNEFLAQRDVTLENRKILRLQVRKY